MVRHSYVRSVAYVPVRDDGEIGGDLSPTGRRERSELIGGHDAPLDVGLPEAADRTEGQLAPGLLAEDHPSGKLVAGPEYESWRRHARTTGQAVRNAAQPHRGSEERRVDAEKVESHAPRRTSRRGSARTMRCAAMLASHVGISASISSALGAGDDRCGLLCDCHVISAQECWGRMVSTGHGLSRVTQVADFPMTTRARALRPWVLIAISDASSSWASSRIAPAANESATSSKHVPGPKNSSARPIAVG